MHLKIFQLRNTNTNASRLASCIIIFVSKIFDYSNSIFCNIDQLATEFEIFIIIASTRLSRYKPNCIYGITGIIAACVNDLINKNGMFERKTKLS